MSAERRKGVYMISAVAELFEIHPQTLRLYEREGLLRPSRTEGTPASIPMRISSNSRPSSI